QKQIEKQAADIAQLIQKDSDAFVKQILAKRAELAGLPWRMGKDCQLTRDQAQSLQMLSRQIRGSLDASVRYTAGKFPDGKPADQPHPEEAYKDAGMFWSTFHSRTGYSGVAV